jgi:hypothetical protein
VKFLWERRGPSRLRIAGGLLALFILLDYDYDLGSAMTSGVIPLVQNYGMPW